MSLAPVLPPRSITFLCSRGARSGAGSAGPGTAAAELEFRNERDADEAQRWFSEFEGAGLDGIVAKPLDGAYLPDKRGWLKIKHVRTADCVVAGYRLYAGDTAAIGSLLLGLYDGDELESVGVVGAFSAATRRELFAELQPLVTTLEGHPWNWGASAAEAQTQPLRRTPRSSEFSRWSVGKDLTFVPLRPERVIEVRYDHMEGRRFRHTAQFVRWRPDRDPASCTFDQLAVAPPAMPLARGAA